MESTKEALEVLESITGRLGNDEEIEAVTADLVDLKLYISTLDSTFDALQEDLSNANEKARSLQSANNLLYRQIGNHERAAEEAKEALSVVSAINEIL